MVVCVGQSNFSSLKSLEGKFVPCWSKCKFLRSVNANMKIYNSSMAKIIANTAF